MRKTDKKIEKQLCRTLTELCENDLKAFTGFQWLTHLVNYDNFPKSLKIIFVFDTNQQLNDFMANNHQLTFNKLIQQALFAIDINYQNINDHLFYDTEENCTQKHKGKWPLRFSQVYA